MEATGLSTFQARMWRFGRVESDALGQLLLHRFGRTIRGNGHSKKDSTMTLHITLIPVLSILAGILILIQPKLLNYVVAIYLIVIGVIQIFGLQI